jgi:hypothetical protein
MEISHELLPVQRHEDDPVVGDGSSPISTDMRRSV